MGELFTICVLLYGDFPKLADRCLRSITRAVPAADLNLRVCMNAAAPRVSDWVRSWVPEENVREYPENPGKYPVMRDLLYGARPISTPYMIWFDDDSYLSPETEYRDGKGWLSLVEQAMATADLLGSVYTIPWQGRQREFVRRQPWYAGKNPGAVSHIRFVTGGWWTARTDVLRRFDYPWKDLGHNGGDAMLGELCRQQGLRIRAFREGVRINADDAGRESAAPRRGRSERPYGFSG